MRKVGAVGLILALSFISLTAVAATKPVAKTTTAAATKSQSLPTIKYEKYKLKNGLEVILSEDHRLPLVAVDVWYHVGPANEKAGRTGFAHLFEHMMFQGSRHVKANEHFKYLEGAGASDINGTTNNDRTNYFETLPANQLDLALWLESDRMGYLEDNVTARNLANQRDVVRNERRQGEQRPYDVVEEKLTQVLLPKGHPYYGNVIGSHADVEAAQLKEILEFHQLYYRPNNATVAIVGDFDPKTIKAKIDKYFAPIAAGAAVPKPNVKTPAITAERRLTVTDQVELPRVYVAWLTPPMFAKGDAEADAAARILGGGKSSRLYKSLVYEKQIAQDVNAFNDSNQLVSSLVIQATAKPGVKPEELEKAINEVVAKFQKEGPTAAEIERARNKQETSLIQGLERLGGFGGVADRLNLYNHYTGDPGYLSKDISRLEALTPASVKAMAATFTPNSRAVVYAVPGKKEIDDVPKREDAEAKKPAPAPPQDKPEEAWRATTPKPAAALAMNLPVPQTFKLNNGMTVMLVESHNLPMLAANVAVLGGIGASKTPGLAGFTTAMLQEGTESRDALKLADDVDQIGATLRTGATFDASAITVSALSRNASAAFDLLSDVTLHPAFRDADIERIRKTRLTNLIQEKDNPGLLANKFLYRTLYGDQHPYAYLETGTEESNKSATRDDLAGYYKAVFAPSNTALVVAGDITLAQLKTLAEKSFGGWTATAATPAIPEAPSAVARKIVLVNKPGANQTMLRVGQIGVARNSPDYVPIRVMNNALGGQFSSRINLNLREVHGYTYGAFSGFQFRRGAGPFQIGGAIRTDVTAPAISEIFKEVDRMRTSEVTPDELAVARDAYARSLSSEFESSARVANSIGTLFVYGLPSDYYRTLPSQIEAVTAADVARVAREHLSPESMVVVGVADDVKVQPEVAKLNLGDTVAVDSNGAALPEGQPTAAGK
jgi:zinc protease